jgi:hypothetical protein
MRAKRVLDALGDVDGRFLADLRPAPAEPKKRKRPLILTAAAMAALCIFGISRLNPPATQDPYVGNPTEQPPANTDQPIPDWMWDKMASSQFVEFNEALDTLFEELAAAGKTTNETLELLKDEVPYVLLDYLMADFMEGGLEGCQLNDGSAGTLKWQTWCSLKGNGELIENVVETPQGDWLDWSQWAENLLRLNGVDFFDEETSPATIRYAYLLGLE